jgi:hypothetical protein
LSGPGTLHSIDCFPDSHARCYEARVLAKLKNAAWTRGDLWLELDNGADTVIKVSLERTSLKIPFDDSSANASADWAESNV